MALVTGLISMGYDLIKTGRILQDFSANIAVRVKYPRYRGCVKT